MKRVRNYLIAAASLFIAALMMTSCESEGLGGDLQTIAVPAQRDTVVEENSILLRTSFSYGVEIEDSALNVEQLNVVELSARTAEPTKKSVKTNSLMSWNVPVTRYVSSEKELGVVETAEATSALDTTSVKEGGLELRKSVQDYTFLFDADTVKVSVKNEKGILGEDTLGYAEISGVEFKSLESSLNETEDSIQNDIHIKLNVIVNAYHENGVEWESKEKEVKISFSRVLLVERNDSVQPEPKDTTVVTPDVPDLNPDDSDDEPAVDNEPSGDDDPADDPAGDEPATDEPSDEPAADEPSGNDPAGDDPATGDDSDNDNDDPVVDVTPVEPEKDPEQVNPTPSEQEPEQEEEPKVFEKNTPADWGEIRSFAVSAAPADNVGGHYAVKAWCLTTSNGAVCGVVGLNDEITLETILSGNFVTGNYSTEYNSAWWNGNCWRPAVARDEAKGAYYYENGSKKAIVPSFDLKIWGWRGGNYSVYMNDYSYSFGESGELIIQHNGNPTLCLK